VTAADFGQIDPAGQVDARGADLPPIAPSSADSPRIEAAVVAGLYERYAEEIGLFLRGVLRNSDLAAEALQNTFAKAVELGHTAREESIKGWLFRVAFNEALLLKRRGQVHERSLRQMARNSPAGAGSERPDERLSRDETLAEVRRALAELPPEQRQVVQMRIYEEKSFAEIADELSTPLGTVLTRMRLAMKKLSRQMRKPGDGQQNL
jgi:RNA polymerase sigma factor (sigma-70 family)